MQNKTNPALLLLGEILAGALAGLALAYLAGRITGATVTGGTGFDDLIAVLSALLLAYPLGVAGGNTLFNRRFRGQASFWLALAGSVGGVLTVLGLAQPLRLNENTTILWVVLSLIPPLFAALVGMIPRRKIEGDE